MPWTIREFEEVESTNDVARRLAEQGAGDRLVVAAERQTGGRGRAGRSWTSEHGGLYLSVVLLPPPRPDRPGLLPLAAGLAVSRAAARFDAPARVKWPNDVEVGRAKLAGILVEASWSGPRPWAVVGVGLNVKNPVPAGGARLADFAAGASLAHARDAVLAELDAALAELEKDPDALCRKWERQSSTVGARVRAESLAAGAVEGIAAGLDGDGALLVRTEAGTRRIVAGDVLHLRPVEP
ncbi:MAG TPA: biotin--[acetyl-CoA-carboxylase] ligase [Candidatus Thermoplasmatota archaeon]|nr:biotin--[acetyl-CoA-carboxylase] ligase [Candidatus Thermoplasmatota archaeon]